MLSTNSPPAHRHRRAGRGVPVAGQRRRRPDVGAKEGRPGHPRPVLMTADLPGARNSILWSARDQGPPASRDRVRQARQRWHWHGGHVCVFNGDSRTSSRAKNGGQARAKWGDATGATWSANHRYDSRAGGTVTLERRARAATMVAIRWPVSPTEEDEDAPLGRHKAGRWWSDAHGTNLRPRGAGLVGQLR